MVDNPQRAGQSGAIAAQSAGLRTVVVNIDIPMIAQDQNVVVEHTDPLIAAAGFEVDQNLIVNAVGGNMHTAIFIGECLVTAADTVRIKFGNNTINPAGPFNDTPMRLTQYPTV